MASKIWSDDSFTAGERVRATIDRDSGEVLRVDATPVTAPDRLAPAEAEYWYNGAGGGWREYGAL